VIRLDGKKFFAIAGLDGKKRTLLLLMEIGEWHLCWSRNQKELEAPNLLSSSNVFCVRLARIDAKRLCQAKVRDLGVHVRIKQDVAGLEIAVDDLQP